ncbi:hypothetical protein [Dokdonia pacifica]|nr:hypothetical protein [Dokdonia pacifica]
MTIHSRKYLESYRKSLRNNATPADDSYGSILKINSWMENGF